MKQALLIMILLNIFWMTLNSEICFDGEQEIKVKKLIQIYPLMQSNIIIQSNTINQQDCLLAIQSNYIQDLQKEIVKEQKRKGVIMVGLIGGSMVFTALVTVIFNTMVK